MTMKETILEKYFLLLPDEIRAKYLDIYLGIFVRNTNIKLCIRIIAILVILLLSNEIIKLVSDKVLGWTISISISILLVMSQVSKAVEISKFAKAVKGGYYPLHYAQIILRDYKEVTYFKTYLGIKSDQDYDEFVKVGGEELLKKIIKSNLRNYYWYKN